MAELPEELIVKILLFLPVTALTRFRCVSKRWCNLIDSPDFRKSHLNLSTKAHGHAVMIFYEKPCAYYFIDFDSVCKASAPPILKQLTKSWRGNPCNFFGAVGVCNGLLCIKTIDFGVFLVNPFTRKHFQVPRTPQLIRKLMIWSWGFGYDSDADDYKVVFIVCSKLSEDGFARFIVWVYSLKSGLWKSIDDSPNFLLGLRQHRGLPYYLLNFRQRGVFVSGALHWRVRPHTKGRDDSALRTHSERDLIIALDLGKLEYNFVPQPDYGKDNKGSRLHLEVLDGCLCVISFDYHTHGFNLWVMKEYGVKESWTRLITCTGYVCYLTPLAYSEDGKELLFVTNSNVIVRYDFETRLFKRMVHYRFPHLGKPLVYIPSLVSPDGGVSAGVS